MYTLTISYNNNEVVMVLPVLPNDGIQLSRSMANTTYDGLHSQINMLGRGNLRSFTLSSIFPCHDYSWINPNADIIYQRTLVANVKPTNSTYYYDGSAGYHYETVAVGSGKTYVDLIEKGRDRMIPFRAILTRDGEEVFNFPISITNFEWGYDAAGDIAYTMECTEYVFPTYTQTQLAVTEAADGIDTEDKSQALLASSISGSSTAVTFDFASGNYQKYYTDNDLYMLAVSACSAQGLTGTIYFNPTTMKYSYSQKDGYTTALKPETLYAAHAWCFCNRANAFYPNEDVSQRITKLTARHQTYYQEDTSKGDFDWWPSRASSIHNYYGIDVYSIIEDTLNRWSAEMQGATNVGRVLPADYSYYYGMWQPWELGVSTFYNFWYGSGHAGQDILSYITNTGYKKAWNWTLASPY